FICHRGFLALFLQMLLPLPPFSGKPLGDDRIQLFLGEELALIPGRSWLRVIAATRRRVVWFRIVSEQLKIEPRQLVHADTSRFRAVALRLCRRSMRKRRPARNACDKL